MKIFILTLAFIIAQQVQASTFVGNGGNAGDLELQMTLKQMQEIFYFLNRDRDIADQNLCICKEKFAGRPVCDMLKDLNAEQVRFCSKYLTLHAQELEKLADPQGSVNFSWTHQPIEVRENSHLRGVDAVTNFQRKSMILNQARFLQMAPEERVFLIGHELFHLTSHQENPLKDEGEVGPFKGMDGGRKLINAMAATLVMTAHEYQVFSGYRETEKRSKSYKKTWVTLSYGGLQTANNKTTPYDIEDTRGKQLGIRYQWTSAVGFLAQISSLEGEKSLLNSTHVNEQKNILSVGGAYRWFPFHNLLAYSGQSHFVFTGTLDFLSATHKLNDSTIGTTSRTTSNGYSLNAYYYMPFNAGVWAYVGVGYTYLPYKFNLDDQINLEYKNGASNFALGVSYGF